MKYKVGDKVRIKSLDWYNANKDEDGNVVCLYSYLDKGMSEFCDKIVTIKSLHGCHNVKAFRIIEDDGYSWWSDDMIEGLVEEPPVFTGKEFLLKVANIELPSGTTKIWECPKGYQFVDENGNVIKATTIVLEKKEKEYLKTYEECCKIIDSDPKFYVDTHLYSGILETLYKLLICRDAYWKLYGEEMGLGKPWKPDWRDGTNKYCIYYNGKEVICSVFFKGKCTLAFPTEEMRDVFYEHFKEEIEQCKELL
jgi:hypothetical protein